MKITAEIREQFLEYYRNQHLKPETIKNYERDFNQFFQLFSARGLSKVEQIRVPIIEEWRSQLRTTPTPKKSVYYGKNTYLSGSTIQGKIQAVKKFLQFVNEYYEI